MWKRSKLKKKIATELQLLSRLKIVGFILCVLGCTFLVCALNAPFFESTIDTLNSSPEDLSGLFITDPPPHSFNFFALAFLFVALGIICLILSWKKTKSLRLKK